MRNFSIETATALTKLHIEEELDALTFIPAVTDLLKKWDGKQLNKRFDTALKEIDARLFYHTRYSAFYISVWTRRDYVPETTKNGTHLACYLSEKYIDLLRTDTNDITGTHRSATTEGKINAAHLIERMQEWEQATRESCSQATHQLAKVADLIAERERLAKAVEDFSRGLNYKISDYFDLSISVRR